MSSASNKNAFGRDFGLIHEAIVTTRKAEWAEAEWAMLAHNSPLATLFRSVMLGDAEIVPVVRTFDGDSPEAGPGGVNPEIVRHTFLGVHKWDDLSFEIFKPTFTPCASRRVKKRERDFAAFNEEEQLPQYLIGKLLGNKNLRDYFLRYPHLIPKEWKNLTWHLSSSHDQILFWGTILRDGYDSSRKLMIPGIRYSGERWYADDCDLEQAAQRHDAFAVLVSPTA